MKDSHGAHSTLDCSEWEGPRIFLTLSSLFSIHDAPD